MKPRMLFRRIGNFTLMGATALALMFAFACAEERPPIDRVQANALPKSFFIGDDFTVSDDDPEFWTNTKVIDVGYGATDGYLFTSTFAQPTVRVKWQITESHLFARAAYERIENTDGKGIATGKETQDGVIVAAFPIESHFDISNDYNSTTGEQLNVVEENTWDRPWYERLYFRVDFSINENTDSYEFDSLSLMGFYGGIEYTPLSYLIEDPNDKDAPVVDLKNKYFDITTKAFAAPKEVETRWGTFPACFLGGDYNGSYPEGNCNPVEITLRHSFRQVEETDYEPVEWDGWRFQAYGAFYSERYGYTREYGLSDEQHHRLINRYSIWEKHHYYEERVSAEEGSEQDGLQVEEIPIRCFIPEEEADLFNGEIGTPYGGDPNRDDNGNGTDDECEGVTDRTGIPGSRCDKYKQMCTLPYRARMPKPIVWYVTNGSNLEYFEPTADAAHNWDVALRTVVNSVRRVECLETGGASCVEDYPMYTGQQRDNDDALFLAMEMDDCRMGKTFPEHGGEEASCGVEIANLGVLRNVSDGVLQIATSSEMVVLCHSPVEWSDHPLCAPDEERLPPDVTAEDCAKARGENDVELLAICKRARNARIGDLRYNQVNLIDTPQSNSPWGIYSDAVDPLTGETVAASINVWTDVTDFWAQRLVDYLRYAGGELEDEDVTEAEYIKNWGQAAEMKSHGHVAGLTHTEVHSRASDFFGVDGADASSGIQDGAAQDETDVLSQIYKLKQDMKGVKFDANVTSTSASTYQARLDSLAGTEVESILMDREMLELSGVDGMPMSDAILDMTSPIRGANPLMNEELERMRHNALAHRGGCEMEMVAAPSSVSVLAQILQTKFGDFNSVEASHVQTERARRMVDYVKKRAHKGVIAHEMGHSVGMRHNFVSSSDAYNYRPQYWQLRTNNKALSHPPGSIQVIAESLSDPSGETVLGPRYFDPLTDNEESNLIHTWQHSSVMEYPGEGTQLFLDLGAYDFAAVRMFYGDVVSVYPKSYANFDATGSAQNRAHGIAQKLDNFGGILGLGSMSLMDGKDIHYSGLDGHFDLIRDCEDVGIGADVQTVYQPRRWSGGADGEDGNWHPVLDGGLVSVAKDVDGRKVYSRCRQQPVDYVSWHNMEEGRIDVYPDTYMPAVSDDGSQGRVTTTDGRLRVPYGFATDRWADLGNAAVWRHDNGADTYEIFNFLSSDNELLHIFDNYRRGRAGFNKRSSVYRAQQRIYAKIRDGAKGLTLQRNFLSQAALDMGYDPASFWERYMGTFFRESFIASAYAFDYFTTVAQRPEIGPHQLVNGVLLSTEDAFYDSEEVVTIPNGAYAPDGNNIFEGFSFGGRLLENKLDDNYGEFSSEYFLNAGSYYEKIFSAIHMTESADNFISDSRSDFVDKRYRAVSLADLLPDGYRRWLANNLTNDAFTTGMRLEAESSGLPIVDNNNMPMGPLGYTQWWGEEPKSCFPVDGVNICRRIESLFDVSVVDYGEEPVYTAVLDPQFGWEVQKHLIVWTYVYLTANEKQYWKDQLWMYGFMGENLDYGFNNRIEFHNPLGRNYLAKTFGKETVFDKDVQKGVAARVLEYANELLFKSYECEGVDRAGNVIAIDEDGMATDSDQEVVWYLPIYGSDGMPIVKYDGISVNSFTGGEIVGCNNADNSSCTCEGNRYCMELSDYLSVLDLMSQMSGWSQYIMTMTGLDFDTPGG